MRRFLPAVAAAVVIVGSTLAPAGAAAAKGPKLGAWTCADAAAAPVAALELFKGNKYAVDGGDKAKYVYKAGQDKVKFKSGVYEDVYYGVYDREAKTITLHSTADDTAWATCSRDAEVPEVPAEPA